MPIEFAKEMIYSRSRGRSSVAASAYRAGEYLNDERTGETHNYTHRNDIAYTELMLPTDAPAHLQDRHTFWNAVEQREDQHNRRLDARVAKDVILVLPRELSVDRQIDMARRFAQTQFVDQRIAVDLAVHRHARGNPHAHLLMPTRRLNHDGFGLKARDLDGQWRRAGKPVVADVQLRHRWADFQNQYFQDNGIDFRVENVDKAQIDKHRQRAPKVDDAVHRSIRLAVQRVARAQGIKPKTLRARLQHDAQRYYKGTRRYFDATLNFNHLTTEQQKFVRTRLRFLTDKARIEKRHQRSAAMTLDATQNVQQDESKPLNGRIKAALARIETQRHLRQQGVDRHANDRALSADSEATSKRYVPEHNAQSATESATPVTPSAPDTATRQRTKAASTAPHRIEPTIKSSASALPYVLKKQAQADALPPKPLSAKAAKAAIHTGDVDTLTQGSLATLTPAALAGVEKTAQTVLRQPELTPALIKAQDDQLQTAQSKYEIAKATHQTMTRTVAKFEQTHPIAARVARVAKAASDTRSAYQNATSMSVRERLTAFNKTVTQGHSLYTRLAKTEKQVTATKAKLDTVKAALSTPEARAQRVRQVEQQQHQKTAARTALGKVAEAVKLNGQQLHASVSTIAEAEISMD